MTYGLRIENPSGVLVLDSQSKNYRYERTFTTGDRVQTGYVDKFLYNDMGGNIYYIGTVFPYKYRVSVPTGVVPIPAVLIQSGQLVDIEYCLRVATGATDTWEISIYGINSTTETRELDTIAVSAPIAGFFTPYSNSDLQVNYGLNLYNSSGNLSWTSNRRPLWLRERVSFSLASAYYSPPVWSPNSNLWTNGQSVGMSSSFSFPATISSTLGYWKIISGANQEDSAEGLFGWTLGTGVLTRRPFIRQRFARAPHPGDEYDISADSIGALILDAGVL